MSRSKWLFYVLVFLAGCASVVYSQQYTVLYTNLADTITAQHTFNPPAPGAPFILGANAIGQTVTGLRADQLARSINLPSIFSGGGALSSDLTITFNSQSANTFLASPSGSAGTPTFRPMTLADLPTGTGTGTVTSVGLSAPTDLFTVTGSPVTTSGTLTVAKTTQSANLVFASPSSGAPGPPLFRPLTLADLPTGTGTGTVTSVGLSAPTDLFTVTGSPVTTSGTLTFAKVTQSANLVFASPSSGVAAAPTFRPLALADMPSGAGGNSTLQLPAKADPASPLAGELWINSASTNFKYRDTGATPATHTVVGLDTIDALSGKTLITPTIASFVNATHNHLNAAGGGQFVHANLLSLTADDHAQYLLASGTRALTGDFPNPITGTGNDAFRVRIGKLWTRTDPVYNVMAYGALGDGTANDAGNIQTALNACSTGTGPGGIVWVPPGVYRLDGPLDVYPGCLLLGAGFGSNSPDTGNLLSPSSCWNSTTSVGDPTKCNKNTTIFAINFIATDLNIPTIKLHNNSGVKGITFTEWNQNPNLMAANPVAYQATIGNYTDTSTTVGGTNDITANRLEDLYFINNYHAIKCNRCVQFHINRIYGNPLSVGLTIDGSTAQGNITNINWGVNWLEALSDAGTPCNASLGGTGSCMLKWLSVNRIGFNFGRMDDAEASDWFMFGGKIGMHTFSGTIAGNCGVIPNLCGGPYIRLAVVGFDGTRNPVVIDEQGGSSIAISDFDFQSSVYLGPSVDTQECVTINTIKSFIELSNGSCRTPRGHGINYSPTNATNDDTALQVSNVTFFGWGQGATTGKAAILINPTNLQGPVIITGNHFRGQAILNGTYGVRYLSPVRDAVMTGNTFNTITGGTNANGVGFSGEAINFTLTGNSFWNSNKAVNATVTDRFTISGNKALDNTNASTVTCATNCDIQGNVGAGLAYDANATVLVLETVFPPAFNTTTTDLISDVRTYSGGSYNFIATFSIDGSGCAETGAFIGTLLLDGAVQQQRWIGTSATAGKKLPVTLAVDNANISSGSHTVKVQGASDAAGCSITIANDSRTRAELVIFKR